MKNKSLKKFFTAFRRAKTFEGWIQRMKNFDNQLVKSNNLQDWTMQDYRNYWAYYKRG